MNRRSIVLSLSSLCVFAPACLSLSTTDPSGGSSSSGAGGAGGESASSSSGKTSSSSTSSSSSSGSSSSSSSGEVSSSSSSGQGGAGGGPTSPLPGWGYRRPVIISFPAEPLNNFIMLVQAENDPAFGNNVQSNGDDLVFTDSDGTTILPYDLETFVRIDGKTSFLAWVRVPQIPGGGKTIYLYYGNSSVGPQENKSDTWQNFKAVYHMQGSFKDATPNAHDGTVMAPMGPAPSSAFGVIDDGQEFFGGAYVEVPHSTDFNCASTSCTISMWVRSSGQSSHVVDHYINTGNGEGWFLGTSDSAIAYTHGGTTPILFNAQMSNDAWHHVALSKSLSQAALYVDGALVQSKFTSGLVNATAPLYIGTGNPSSLFFVGRIDELRIASTNRNAAWIQAEVINSASPNDFVNLGTPEQF